jgi:hypothetical protein
MEVYGKEELKSIGATEQSRVKENDQLTLGVLVFEPAWQLE